MRDDLDFAGQIAAGAEQPMNALFGGVAGAEEAERALSSLLPRFDYYHARFEEGKYDQTKDGKPRAHFTLRVVSGPEGTEGRVVFDDLFLFVNETRITKEGEKEARSPEEFAKAVGEFQSTLKRIATQLRLALPAPVNDGEAAITAYAEQFKGKECIIAVGVSKETAEFPARNRVIWRSIAALDAQVKDAKGKIVPGKTAKQEADEKVQKQAAKGVGRTARSFAGMRAAAAEVA